MVKQVKRQRSKLAWGNVAIYAVLSCVFVTAAYPFFYILSLAVMPYEEYIKHAIHAGPAGFTWFYFEQIFRNGHLVNSLGISVLRTVAGATISVIATILAGYVLARPELKYRRIIGFFFTVPIFVGGGIIPFFLVVQGIGLTNTFWALIIPNLVAPFNLFLVKAYFTDYPSEIVEAAIVDGAGHWRIFWQIIWPTSIPIIATMGLLYGVGLWNDYITAGILVSSDLYPATVVLKDMTNTRLVDFVGGSVPFVSQSFIAAVSTILIVPMLLVYPLIQRYLVRGLTAGAVKG